MKKSAAAMAQFIDGFDVTSPLSYPLLALDEPPPYGLYNGAGSSDIVLICEHASPLIPRALGDLGVSQDDRMRHIGWDIGALRLAEALADRLDAPLFYSNYSRLVLDANRPLGAAQMFPEVSDGTEIPGNLGLSEADKALRADHFLHPLHGAIASYLDERQTLGQPTKIVSVHSFTPVYGGIARPWHIGVLYGASEAYGQELLRKLAQDPDLVSGDNEPYRIDENDYAIPVHGDQRGLPALLLELRHDLIKAPEDIGAWADRLAKLL